MILYSTIVFTIHSRQCYRVVEPGLWNCKMDSDNRSYRSFRFETFPKELPLTGSLLLCWQTNIFSASYRYHPISSRRNSISFCCYLHHQFFNRQRLRAGHYKIPAQQQALNVVCNSPISENQIKFFQQTVRQNLAISCDS